MNDKIVKIPSAGLPQQFSAEEIWAAPEPTDRQVWGVCPYVKIFSPKQDSYTHGDLEKCRGCPQWIDDPDYGKMKPGCRAIAEEICRIVMAGESHE